MCVFLFTICLLFPFLEREGDLPHRSHFSDTLLEITYYKVVDTSTFNTCREESLDLLGFSPIFGMKLLPFVMEKTALVSGLCAYYVFIGVLVPGTTECIQ